MPSSKALSSLGSTGIMTASSALEAGRGCHSPPAPHTGSEPATCRQRKAHLYLLGGGAGHRGPLSPAHRAAWSTGSPASPLGEPLCSPTGLSSSSFSSPSSACAALAAGLSLAADALRPGRRVARAAQLQCRRSVRSKHSCLQRRPSACFEAVLGAKFNALASTVDPSGRLFPPVAAVCRSTR